MIGGKIEAAYPVREDEPDWRDEGGFTLHQALIEMATPHRWPTETERDAIGRQVHAGTYKGMRLLGAQRGWVAVWHPTLVAYVAQLRISCDTQRDLHHALHRLVSAGQLQPCAASRKVPRLGQAWHYILKAGE